MCKWRIVMDSETTGSTGKLGKYDSRTMEILLEVLREIGAAHEEGTVEVALPSSRARGLALAIAKDRSASAEDVYLRALSLYKLALEAEAAGNHLAIINPQDEVVHDV